MGIKLKNNARSTLLASITAADTVIVLESGGGNAFPTLSAGEHFFATIVATSGSYEIVDVTARSGDILTVTRAAENTTATAFPAGSLIELRVTAGTITEAVTAVTSINVSGGTTGLTFTGGPITTSGTITAGGTLGVANGGTGVTTSTGSGSVVLSTSPTLVTPTLGVASATSIAAGLGAAATPSYTFTGDLNTGFWSPGADILAASTGGSERMRITSAGYVGIGTSTPGFELDVKGAGTTTSARIVGGGITTPPASGGTLTIHTLTQGVARTGLDISFTDGAGSRLGGFKFSDTQTAGNWVVCQMEMVQSYGAANEIVSKLQVEDAAWAGMRFVSQTNAGAALATSPTFIWRNYTTEQMRITAAGNIQLGGGVLATNATNGFPYIPTCAGTPTGTPTAISGFAPMVVDSTNNKLYVYIGGAWQAMN